MAIKICELDIHVLIHFHRPCVQPSLTVEERGMMLARLSELRARKAKVEQLMEQLSEADSYWQY